MIDSVRCEVLNASYDPLSIVSARRALTLCIKGKATVLREHPSYTITSGRDIHGVPTQILLNEMVKTRRTTRVPAILTQRNMFIRDMYMCTYCGRHRSELHGKEFLTRDHIHPQSKGGLDEWKNVVTACNSCNNKKADYTLDEIGMVLRKEPHIPTVFEIWAKSNSRNKRFAQSA